MIPLSKKNTLTAKTGPRFGVKISGDKNLPAIVAAFSVCSRFSWAVDSKGVAALDLKEGEAHFDKFCALVAEKPGLSVFDMNARDGGRRGSPHDMDALKPLSREDLLARKKELCPHRA